MPGVAFGSAFHVVPSVENDGARPFAGTARCRLTGAPKRVTGAEVCESVTRNCTAEPVGDGGADAVNVTTAVAEKAPLVQVAVDLPSPEPTEPAGGGGAGGGGAI